MVLAPLLRSALDLATGVRCVGCGAAGLPACPRCLDCLSQPAPARPSPCPSGLPPTVASATYSGAARALVLAHKEDGQLALAAPLGRALAAAVAATVATRSRVQPTQPLLLVPVPSRPGSARRRGHDPLLRIARVAARHLRAAGESVEVAPVLRFSRRVVDQAGLDSAARWGNLHAALAVPAGLRVLLRDRRLVLVDDVLTTGATLAEGARALRAAGCPAVAAAVVAATERRRGSGRSRGSCNGMVWS